MSVSGSNFPNVPALLGTPKGGAIRSSTMYTERSWPNSATKGAIGVLVNVNVDGLMAAMVRISEWVGGARCRLTRPAACA